MRLTAGSDNAIHDAMESPPKMLQVADGLWLMYHLGKMMMDMQAATTVHSCTDVLDDLQGWRQDPFNFIPKHWSRLDFELAPAEPTVLGLVTKAGVVFNGKLTVRRQRLLCVAT